MLFVNRGRPVLSITFTAIYTTHYIYTTHCRHSTHDTAEMPPMFTADADARACTPVTPHHLSACSACLALHSDL